MVWRVTAAAVALIVIVVFVAWKRRARAVPLTRIALTGNIASGKSAVASVWRDAGASIIDADELARAAVAPGTRGLSRVLAAFGPTVRASDGTLDRAALRAIVFDDSAQRERLEAILHPEIERLRQAEEQKLRARGVRTVVHAIPLLFETGMDESFDIIVLVDAPAEVRRRRLVETRGLSDAEATAMIAAQMDAAVKRARSHYVIDNDGTLDELKSGAKDVWARIGGRA